MQLNGKKIYFISDLHLGIPNYVESKTREIIFINWLENIRKDASAIFIMGDLFDFWFEYKTVVPKGYSRLFGKLVELTDSGIEIHLFRGNHDIWAFDYLQTEIGIQLHRKPEILTIENKKFFLAHGDGLGPGDHGFKLMKSIFECRFFQWLYKWIHPDWGTRIGAYFSKRSRLTKTLKGEADNRTPESIDSEPMVIFSRQMANNDNSINYYIFGHVHYPKTIKFSNNSQCIVLGDWVVHYTYACFDGNELELIKYNPATNL